MPQAARKDLSTLITTAPGLGGCCVSSGALCRPWATNVFNITEKRSGWLEGQSPLFRAEAAGVPHV